MRSWLKWDTLGHTIHAIVGKKWPWHCKNTQEAISRKQTGTKQFNWLGETCRLCVNKCKNKNERKKSSLKPSPDTADTTYTHLNMFVKLTSGSAVSELLQFYKGCVGELIQLQVFRRHEEQWHAVHCYLHRHKKQRIYLIQSHFMFYMLLYTDRHHSQHHRWFPGVEIQRKAVG